MPDYVPGFAFSTVDTAPSPADSGTSLVLPTGEGARFPDPADVGPYNATVHAAGARPVTAVSPNAERIRITAKSTDTLTIVRAQEGTTARSILVGDLIFATPSALDIAVEQALRCGEIKGWPTIWEDNTDLVSVAAWFASVGSPTTAATRVDLSGESLEAVPFGLHGIKVITDAADEGFSQVFTYADEPRFKSGYIAPPIAFLVGATTGPPDVTAKLVNSDSGETEAELVKLIGGDWALYVIRGHMCSGTSVTLSWTKDTSGTFYVVPLGERPKVFRARDATSVKSLDGIADEDTWTDIDCTSATSALAFMAILQARMFESEASTIYTLHIRRNGSAEAKSTTTNAVIQVDGTGHKRPYAEFTFPLDQNQILEYLLDRNAGASALDSGAIVVRGWWEWA